MKSVALVALLFAIGCASAPAPPPRRDLGAGFRWSAYGPEYHQPPEYWAIVGLQMTKRFEGAMPETVWIVGKKHGVGIQLGFPVQNTKDPLITGIPEETNDAMLSLFDRLGYRVWLQVEPAYASVDELIDLVMARYSHHPSVIGFGVDVEWYCSTSPDYGQAITDAEAKAWLKAVRKYNKDYRVFLKHWLPEKMPPTAREGLLFIDDSQILPSLDAMVAEFAKWGRAFAPAPVAFQYGYKSDRPWWIRLEDPPKAIGQAILNAVPNTEGLYWVDFTVLEVFPPVRLSPPP